MTLSARDQSLLVGVLAVSLAASAWFFWLAPMALAIGQTNNQLAQLDQQKSSLTNRVAFLTATSQDLATHPDAVKLLQLAAPSNGGMENLVASFDTMATTSGVNLASFQPAAAADQPNALTLTVSASGSFTALQAFVAAIEHNIRPFTIQTMSLASSAAAGGATTETISLSMTTPQIVAGATKSAAGTQ